MMCDLDGEEVLVEKIIGWRLVAFDVTPETSLADELRKLFPEGMALADARRGDWIVRLPAVSAPGYAVVLDSRNGHYFLMTSDKNMKPLNLITCAIGRK